MDTWFDDLTTAKRQEVLVSMRKWKESRSSSEILVRKVPVALKKAARDVSVSQSRYRYVMTLSSGYRNLLGEVKNALLGFPEDPLTPFFNALNDTGGRSRRGGGSAASDEMCARFVYGVGLVTIFALHRHWASFALEAEEDASPKSSSAKSSSWSKSSSSKSSSSKSPSSSKSLSSSSKSSKPSSSRLAAFYRDHLQHCDTAAMRHELQLFKQGVKLVKEGHVGDEVERMNELFLLLEDGVTSLTSGVDITERFPDVHELWSVGTEVEEEEDEGM